MSRKWKDAKVLPVLVAFVFVLLLSAGAQAYGYSDKGDDDKSKKSDHSFSVPSFVYKLSFNEKGDKGDDWEHDKKGFDRKHDKKGNDHFKKKFRFLKKFKKHKKDRENCQPVPEPSAALVFGVGLLVTSQVRRRKS